MYYCCCECTLCIHVLQYCYNSLSVYLSADRFSARMAKPVVRISFHCAPLCWFWLKLMQSYEGSPLTEALNTDHDVEISAFSDIRDAVDKVLLM